MITQFVNASELITFESTKKGSKKDKSSEKIKILQGHSIIVEDGIIKDFASNNTDLKKYDRTVDLKGKAVLPGLVECHTHSVFAGSRANEFKMRLNGSSYEEIAKAGGGINATVNAVRKSTFDELVALVQPRIDYFISQGVTTLEIKSGYGLSFYDEIKLLQVINQLNVNNSIEIIPTFLGAHTYPIEYKNDHAKYHEIIISEMIPYISKNKLAEFCDAFCEPTAFAGEAVDEIFSAAENAGLKLKLHTEQFNNIGGLDVALKHRAVSVDHLEVIKDEDISKLTGSETVAVLLPGVSYFLDYDFAPARKLIDAGATVALATDYNPGSSNISNISLIMSLAVIKMKMSFEEAIKAYTLNAAKALDRSKRIGSLEIGKQADFSVFDTEEHSGIFYEPGKNLNFMTIKNGEVIYNRMS